MAGPETREPRPQAQERPRARRAAHPRRRVAGLRRQGRRAPERLRRLRRRRPARRPRQRRGHQGQARLRRGLDHGSCSATRPTAFPPRCDHGGEPCPGAPWQALAYEQQLRHKQSQVEDSLVRLGGLEGFELEPIEPAVERWRYRNKLEYSFGERDGRARPRLPRPRPLGPDRRRRGLPARLRAQQRLAATRSADWARRRGPSRLRPPLGHGRAPQPGRPRGPPHRAAADPPRHLPGRDPAAARRPAHDRRGPQQRHRRPDRRARRASTSRRSSAGCASGSPTAPSSRPTPRWPSASTGSRPRWPA